MKKFNVHYSEEVFRNGKWEIIYGDHIVKARNDEEAIIEFDAIEEYWSRYVEIESVNEVKKPVRKGFFLKIF